MLHVGAGRRDIVPYNNTKLGPLDIVTGAAAAYGVRRLLKTYTGFALNIRRSSDNSTKDIGFVNGNLDAATFSNFVGSGSGFVAKWYDQSGNNRDASQATAASQPQLVLNAVGGRPALKFSGAQLLSSASFASSTSPESWVAVAERTGAFTSGAGVIAAGGTGNGILCASSVNTVWLTATSTLAATASDGVPHSLIGVNNGASSVMSVDGVDATGTDGGDVSTSSAIDIGSDGTHDYTGYITEAWIMLSGTYSAAQRASIRNNQKAYYGLP